MIGSNPHIVAALATNAASAGSSSISNSLGSAMFARFDLHLVTGAYRSSLGAGSNSRNLILTSIHILSRFDAIFLRFGRGPGMFGSLIRRRQSKRPLGEDNIAFES